MAAAQQATPNDDDSLDLFDSDVEQTEWGWDRLSVSVGYTELNADGRFDAVTPDGDRITIIDLDRLNVDDEDGSAWATLNWRSAGSRWGAWFGYWEFSGSGTQTWEDDLEIEDGEVIPVGAAVNTQISTDWYIVEATYSFYRNERWDAGIGLGFHVVDIDTRLDVEGSIGDEDLSESVVNLDTLAPLPNVLGYVHWRLGDRWLLTSRLGWFSLSYDKFSGEMMNFHGMLRFNLTQRWSLEAGYQFVELDVDVEKNTYTQVYDMEFDGPIAVVRFSF